MSDERVCSALSAAYCEGCHSSECQSITGSKVTLLAIMLSPEQTALIGRVFESYLTEHHAADMTQVCADARERSHHAVLVNAMTLFEANMEVGDYFNAYPHDVLAIFDEVLHRKASELSDRMSLSNEGRVREKTVQQTLHARITGLPVCPELTRDTIPRSRDVGHFLSVTGTVIRTSVAKVLQYERDYMCSKCHHVFMVQADFHQHCALLPPTCCPNADACNSFKFRCLSEECEPAACRDYQEIKIQEQVQRLSVGSVPRALVVVLEDDLVDSCKSGDDVTVYGVCLQRWRPLSENACCDVELVLKANNVELNNSQSGAAALVKDLRKEFQLFWNHHKHNPIAGRNHILLSLCPQVFGMYVVKLAVALLLCGGVQRADSSGAKIRGECHLLLIGDPGTGKSQFLKYAAKIVPRSVLTTGIGSTNAGLTVAAVKDGGDWHLEAGALVLSDGGLCCIDEFNSIKEHDRISIHEAMEQQSISVAKAGIVCKLNTRTSILAAANPKGRYNPDEPLCVNVALASPLLSRFDLVLVLLDTRDAEWDRIISSFILEDRGLPSECSSLWSLEKMRAYFSVVRGLQPHFSPEANLILTRYFQMQRQSSGRSAARTTIRMLESLSRLAEAHARLMYRERVTVEDAVTAVCVMECSMQGAALLGQVNTLLTSFPEEPVLQYQGQCQQLLTALDLPAVLRSEMERLQRLKTSSCEDHLSGSPNPRGDDAHICPSSGVTTSTPQKPSCRRDAPWTSPVPQSPRSRDTLHPDHSLSSGGGDSASGDGPPPSADRQTAPAHQPPATHAAAGSRRSEPSQDVGEQPERSSIGAGPGVGGRTDSDLHSKLSRFTFRPQQVSDGGGDESRERSRLKRPKSRGEDAAEDGPRLDVAKEDPWTDRSRAPAADCCVRTADSSSADSARSKLSQFVFSDLSRRPRPPKPSGTTHWEGQEPDGDRSVQQPETVGSHRKRKRWEASCAASCSIFSGLVSSPDPSWDALDTDWDASKEPRT